MPSSSYLSYIAERSTELFFAYNLEKEQFMFMNATCISFFNLENMDIKASALLHTVHAHDQKYVLSKLQACADGTTVNEIECRFTRGKYERWLRINPHLMLEDGERIILGQAKDITDDKTKIELLNNHNIKKNSILTILAHDLAGPLGVVQNLSTMLKRETSLLKNVKVDHYIHMINKISRSSIELIQDFLNQEFLDSVNVTLSKKRVELVNKINIGTEEFLAMQEELKIQFSCHANKEMIYADVDEDKFMQVINNLISNSLKFTPAGGKIEVNIEENNDELLLTVADNGIGIPQQYHATLFDKFTNARRSGLNGEHSTGLGMSIIKTIVEWHQGEIWFESEENKGTTFFIRLPK